MTPLQEQQAKRLREALDLLDQELAEARGYWGRLVPALALRKIDSVRRALRSRYDVQALQRRYQR